MGIDGVMAGLCHGVPEAGGGPVLDVSLLKDHDRIVPSCSPAATKLACVVCPFVKWQSGCRCRCLHCCLPAGAHQPHLP